MSLLKTNRRTRIHGAPARCRGDAAPSVEGGRSRYLRRSSMKSVVLIPMLALLACGQTATGPHVGTPGVPAGPKTSLLDAGAAVIQDKPPVNALNTYLNGFHFYNGRLDEQMEAHHYCATLNEDVTQCVIFDGNTRDARIMGVEYVVSARLFAGLDNREKWLWHSHAYEVASGTLAAPGLPALAEHELMERLIGTYGKTWHTWHSDQRKELPLGMPQLMMAFTADGQAHPPMISARDARLGINSVQNRSRRTAIPVPAPVPGADAWMRGEVVQITDTGGTDHHAPLP